MYHSGAARGVAPARRRPRGRSIGLNNGSVTPATYSFGRCRPRDGTAVLVARPILILLKMPRGLQGEDACAQGRRRWLGSRSLRFARSGVVGLSRQYRIADPMGGAM